MVLLHSHWMDDKLDQEDAADDHNVSKELCGLVELEGVLDGPQLKGSNDIVRYRIVHDYRDPVAKRDRDKVGK